MAEMNQKAYQVSYSDFLSILDICAEANDMPVYNVIEPIFMKAYNNWDKNSRNYMMTLSAEDYAALRKAIYSLPFQYAERTGRTLYRAQIINPVSATMSNNQNIR